MNRAEQTTLAYSQKRMSFTELLIETSEIADAYKQDYENETTSFEYADGSISVFCGVDASILAYACK